ncbi:hypothetical protein, partial [Pseudomonas syringae group genomosp. 7]|uniref:hypothetical protein n=1 Tax=Pseudomonas syringae group genomosp. 7 TaxID=251699 RepID=UPI00376FF01C
QQQWVKPVKAPLTAHTCSSCSAEKSCNDPSPAPDPRQTRFYQVGEIISHSEPAKIAIKQKHQ